MRILSRKKISSKDLKVVSRQLSSMLKSGCDIITCLEIIIAAAPKNVSEAFRRTLRSVQRGKSLAESFAFSTYFNKFFISMVQAGEVSGKIHYVFYRMASYYDRQSKLKAKILGACIYPLILLLVSAVAFVFMLVFVVPNFERAFESYDGVDIEGIFIFRLSHFLRDHYLFLLVVLLGLMLYIVRSIKKSKSFKSYIDEALFKIPKIRKVNQMYVCDRFSRSLSILISSGVNIEESMDIAARTLNSSYVDYKLKLARSYIESGSSISKSLAKTGIFPDVFISMMLAGEESGSFDESLAAISDYYESELDIELENLSKLIEPVMLLVMGIMIGSVLISILSPMFEILSSIS